MRPWSLESREHSVQGAKRGSEDVCRDIRKCSPPRKTAVMEPVAQFINPTCYIIKDILAFQPLCGAIKESKHRRACDSSASQAEKWPPCDRALTSVRPTEWSQRQQFKQGCGGGTVGGGCRKDKGGSKRHSGKYYEAGLCALIPPLSCVGGDLV
ncbi:unnamed protein product [Pleuronectes platessa]|uniref:Uncharacterized protein n=1 Tax=Pleuronectes platessa TaxID=8262 RepID=A0A9N7V6D9_PLEPL|nr:unnamed protein product [Pleuronectes platessa]